MAASSLEITLISVQGEEAGAAAFGESSDGLVAVAVTVEGLETGDHGIHVHAVGMCDPGGLEPFSTAGPHYNPNGATHGGPDDPKMHAGDLGNITVDDDGTGTLDATTDAVTLIEGPPSLFDMDGSALMMHQDPDDLQTDPSGQSGRRVVCGVVAEPMSGPSGAATAAVEGSASIPSRSPSVKMCWASLMRPRDSRSASSRAVLPIQG